MKKELGSKLEIEILSQALFLLYKKLAFKGGESAQRN